MSIGIHLVFVTAPDESTAAEIARTVVSEHHAACVNILPGVRSLYHWEGKLQDDSEVLMILKTSEARYPELEARLLELHPYSNPEVVAVSPENVAEKYLAWVRAETMLS